MPEVFIPPFTIVSRTLLAKLPDTPALALPAIVWASVETESELEELLPAVLAKIEPTVSV